MKIATEIWIVDASPFIFLAKIGLSHLLTEMSFRLTIPEDVVREINAAPPEDAGRQALIQIDKNRNPIIYAPAPKPSVAAFRLGAGESSVLSAALDRPNYRLAIVALLDDRKAKIAAYVLGIQTLGTVGILIRAKDNDEISALVPYLHRLRSAGMWLDDEFCRTAAQSVMESWP